MDVSGVEGFRQRPRWLAVVALLLAGQAWLTLRLFSSDLSFERLTNDEPIVSGRHPLHHYHGMIGAKAWQDRDTSSCYDPAYQAHSKTWSLTAELMVEFFHWVGAPADP
jgi:hypothetical protein